MLANIFLHVAFDKWMQDNHADKPFVRYADDIVVHCRSERQAKFMLSEIQQRLSACKLNLHPEKTKIVNLRGTSIRKYPRSFDFLGFTFRPHWCRVSKGLTLMPTMRMSMESISSVLEKFRALRIHKWRKPVEELAKELNPIIRGVINYYCKFWTNHTIYLWYQLNYRLLKWVKWEKGLYKRAAVKWLKKKYKEKPALFAHWKLVHP